MKLHWFGHSCFQMTFSDGTRVVTDPFDERIGYPVPQADAEIVTCSHAHFDHGYAEAIGGSPVVIRETGSFNVRGIAIDGMASFHDEAQGTKRGPNVLYRFRADGLTIVHLGDLGHFPNGEQLAFISDADILMIPIGGFYTIDTDTALKIIEAAKPKMTIGMHFRSAAIPDFPVSDEAQFTEALNAVHTGMTDMEFTAETMKDQPAAIIMAY